MSPSCTHNCSLPNVRLSDALLETIRQHAEEQGETLSDFVRRALRETIARDHLARRLKAVREAFKDQVFITEQETRA